MALTGSANKSIAKDYTITSPYISIDQLLREGSYAPQEIEGVIKELDKKNTLYDGTFIITMRDFEKKDKYIIAGNEFSAWSSDDNDINQIIQYMYATIGQKVQATVKKQQSRQYILKQLKFGNREFNFYSH